MSREIKFRAWEKSFHKMYFDTEYLMVCHDKIFHKYDGTEFKISNSNCDFMQFTGLIDKNKVEIFEGDIIKWGHLKNSKEYSHRYAVVEINPDIQFKIIFYIDSKTGEKKPTDNYIFHLGRFAYSGKELEIIGNVFQNPELLETVQK